MAITGRPGPVFLDLPGDVLSKKVNMKVQLGPLVRPPIYYPDPEEVIKAVYTLKTAKTPLVIVGKGAAYSRAEN